MGTADISQVEHKNIEVNGVRLHLAQQGQGPLVVLLHGFPESWYSWRHQFLPLAKAGYRVVAPDQRGYARSERPEAVEEYTLPHLVGDVVALVRALGESQAVVVGHDWGAPVAWSTAMMRPDVVRGVAGLSVPPLPPTMMPSISTARQVYGEGYYQVLFQERGVVDAQLAEDPAASLRRILAGACGERLGTADPEPWVVPQGKELLETVPEPEQLPSWLSTQDVAAFAADYERHGAHALTGPLNWYRNIDRNQGLMSPFQGRTIDVPSLYMIGDKDMVAALEGVPELRKALTTVAPRLHKQITLPGCGHWTQQERPEQVNEALLDFLKHVQGGN